MVNTRVKLVSSTDIRDLEDKLNIELAEIEKDHANDSCFSIDDIKLDAYSVKQGSAVKIGMILFSYETPDITPDTEAAE